MPRNRVLFLLDVVVVVVVVSGAVARVHKEYVCKNMMIIQQYNNNLNK